MKYLFMGIFILLLFIIFLVVNLFSFLWDGSMVQKSFKVFLKDVADTLDDSGKEPPVIK